MKKISSLVFYLYFALILLFPLGVIIRFSPIVNVNVYPQDLLVGLISLITLLVILFSKKMVHGPILKAIVLFNVAAFLSLLINPAWTTGSELVVSLSYLARLNAYLLLLFVGIFEFSKSRIKILRNLFLISSLLVVVFGFIQYFFYNNLRNLYYLGWDEHLYRLFSTFLDPNYAGLYFVVLAVFLFGNGLKQEKLNQSYIFVVVTLVALILTYSRTAIISFLVGIIFMLAILKKAKILVFSILALVLGVGFFSNFSIEGMNPFRIASSEARVESFQKAYSIFMDSPIFGVGFNSYRYAQIEKGYRVENPTIVSNADAGTDNSLMFVLATMGVVGLFTYLNMWKRIIEEVKLSSGFNKTTAFSIILALFVGSLFINALFYMPVMLWVLIYLGLFILNEKN